MCVSGVSVVDNTFTLCDDGHVCVSGVAYKGVMCKYGSVSVVENTFTYQMIDTAAHELGHRWAGH